MVAMRSRRGQFFIISAVLIISIFITMYQALSSYGSVDLSAKQTAKEAFLLYDIREQANRTVFMARDCGSALANLNELKGLVESRMSVRGQRIDFNFGVAGCPTGAEKAFTANFDVMLQSDDSSYTASFSSVRT